jgi:hypothetical protein
MLPHTPWHSASERYLVPPNGHAVAVGVSPAVAARDDSGWSLVNEGTGRSGAIYACLDRFERHLGVGGDLCSRPWPCAYGGPQVVPGGPIE